MVRRRALLGWVTVGVLVIGATAVTVVSRQLGPTAQAATTAGCGKAPTLRNGTQTIQSSGKSRSFVLRIPDNYNNNNAYRLVFGFHWLNGSASNVVNDQYYGLLPLSNNSTIFVAPQGLNAGWANSGGEDVTFTDDMIRVISNDLCVETSQIFSTGFSYGGGMSFALACARANVFRAVAVIAGGQISGCSGGTQRIAYLGIHGISDNVLNISGGRGLRDRFVRNNGCAAQNPAEPSQGSGRHIVTNYSGCAAGYPVTWAAFDGGHIYQPRDAGSNVAWVPALTWQFFTQFGSTTPPTTPPTTRATTPPTTRATTPPTTTVTTPPTTTPPTTAPTGTGDCTATYQIVGQWPGGFQANVTVQNTGSAAISGWNVTWTFQNGQTISQIWGGTNTPSGANQSVRNVSWNGSLAPNASTTFGFLGSAGSTNSVPTNVACTRA